MIFGIHALVYSDDPASDRAFFRRAFRWRSIDIHDGWLIFALPPAELAFHPSERGKRQELWLMTRDMDAARRRLTRLGARRLARVIDHDWGLASAFTTPGGTRLNIYQPKHRVAIRTTPSKPGGRGTVRAKPPRRTRSAPR